MGWKPCYFIFMTSTSWILFSGQKVLSSLLFTGDQLRVYQNSLWSLPNHKWRKYVLCQLSSSHNHFWKWKILHSTYLVHSPGDLDCGEQPHRYLSSRCWAEISNSNHHPRFLMHLLLLCFFLLINLCTSTMTVHHKLYSSVTIQGVL